MEPTATDAIIQFMPIMFLQLIYAAIVFVVAQKRHVNPWIWTIASLVPVCGLFVSGVFMLLSFLSMLDRLNVLENKTAS